MSEQEPKKEGCRSVLKTFLSIVLGGFIGNFLVTLLLTQCQEPEYSDYLEYLERQENRR